MKNPKGNKRTHQERIEIIFDFIDKQPNIFPKSRMNEIGLNPRTAEMWLKLIEYIQNQPRIRLIETDHNLFIEKIEGKYQNLMKKLSTDENEPFEKRMEYLTNYLTSLYAREKTIDHKDIPNQIVQNTKYSVEPKDIINQILEYSRVLLVIDKELEIYFTELKNLDRNSSSEQVYYALSKWQKDVLMNKEFQGKFKLVTNKEHYLSELDKISEKFPDFVVNMKESEVFFTSYYKNLKNQYPDWFFE